MTSIIELEDKLNSLKTEDKESYKIFKRIYSVYSGTGTMKIPPGLKNKVVGYFSTKDESGNPTETHKQVLHKLENQKIVKTFNRWTGEGALFNCMRTNRPGMGKEDLKNQKNKLSQLINESQKNCDFCQPDQYTPEDVFGRIKGKHSITASNIAKYDVWSSLVIFKNHDPLKFTLEELSDYIDTGFHWFDKVFQTDETYKCPFFVWNCLYKAGASQIHGHAQILMGKDIPYAKVEVLKKAQSNYQKRYHEKSHKGLDPHYFQDLYQAHHALGLGYTVDGVSLYASITPAKEKEITILLPESPSTHKNSKKVIFNILRCFIDVLGVHSYNLSIYCPPRDREYDFPYLIKIVDRGSIFRPPADMGGMELFGSTVVADDPYEIIHHIIEYFKIHEIE